MVEDAVTLLACLFLGAIAAVCLGTALWCGYSAWRTARHIHNFYKNGKGE